MEPQFHTYPPPVDAKRLAELEAFANQHGARFYTLEVCPSNRITISWHSDTIYNKRISGGDLPFEKVLDHALQELKAHILSQSRNEKP